MSWYLTVRWQRIFYRFTGNGGVTPPLNENFNSLKTVNASDTKFCKQFEMDIGYLLQKIGPKNDVILPYSVIFPKIRHKMTSF